MPQHPDGEMLPGGLQTLDRAIFRPRGRPQAFSNPARRLVMMGWDVCLVAEGKAQEAPGLEPHVVTVERAPFDPVVVRAHSMGEVLNQIASTDDIQKLHSPADPQDGKILPQRKLQE